MAEKRKTFSTLIQISKNVLASPKEYFTSLEPDKTKINPYILSLFFGLSAGIISFLLSMLNIDTLNSLSGINIRLGAVIIMPIVAILSLFIASGMIWILATLFKGDNTFKTILLVSASLQVILPINSFFQISYGVSPYLGYFIEVIISLYALYLLYFAFVHTLSINEKLGKTLIITFCAVKVIWSLYDLNLGSNSAYIYYNQDKAIQQNQSEGNEGFKKALDKYNEYIKEVE
ncbi:MAG: YIP1 family protein [Spirochaetes bacterium]|nr:YIP1 family protein [Spirochaetota bacterium]